MEAAILIVGEDQVLSQTRALLLPDWEVATAQPSDAPAALRARAYDLVIFCQSVRDSFAQQLLAEAAHIHPEIKSLAICEDEGRARHFSSTTFVSRLNNAGAFREAVASLLQANRRQVL